MGVPAPRTVEKSRFTVDDFCKKRRMHRGSPRGVVHIEPLEPLG